MSAPLSTFSPFTLSRPASARQAGTALVRAVAAVIRAWNHRRQVMRLMDMDERELRDIGLVRGDVIGALSEPIGVDPSTQLALRAMENRHRFGRRFPR